MRVTNCYLDKNMKYFNKILKISRGGGNFGLRRLPGGGVPGSVHSPRVADLFKLGVIGGSRPGYVQKCTFDQPDTSGWNRPKYIGLNSAFFDPPGGVPIFRAQCTILDPPLAPGGTGGPTARAGIPARYHTSHVTLRILAVCSAALGPHNAYMFPGNSS